MSTTNIEIDPPGIIEEYRKFLNDTSWYTHSGEHNAPELMYLTLGLAGESGEFTDAVKKIIRVCGSHDDKGFAALMAEKDGGEEKLLEELGDVLWYVTKLTDFLGVSLNALMVANTYKLYNRLVSRNIDVPNLEWPFEHPSISYENVQKGLE